MSIDATNQALAAYRATAAEINRPQASGAAAGGFDALLGAELQQAVGTLQRGEQAGIAAVTGSIEHPGGRRGGDSSGADLAEGDGGSRPGHHGLPGNHADADLSAMRRPAGRRAMLTDIAVQEVSREAIWVMLKVGAPVMGVALVVGLIVSLLQALTQMQEMTLTFVPKIIAIFLTLLVVTPFMLTTLVDFTQTCLRPDRRRSMSARHTTSSTASRMNRLDRRCCPRSSH